MIMILNIPILNIPILNIPVNPYASVAVFSSPFDNELFNHSRMAEDPCIALEPSDDGNTDDEHGSDNDDEAPLRRRRKPISTVGAFSLVLIIACSNGFWILQQSGGNANTRTPDSGNIVGMALTRWSFMDLKEVESCCPSWLLKAEISRSRASVHRGFFIIQLFISQNCNRQ